MYNVVLSDLCDSFLLYNCTMLYYLTSSDSFLLYNCTMLYYLTSVTTYYCTIVQCCIIWPPWQLLITNLGVNKVKECIHTNQSRQFVGIPFNKSMNCHFVSLFIKILSKTYLHTDYHIAFLISESSSALGPDKSARYPVGLWADIRTYGWRGIWYKKKRPGYLFILYIVLGTRKHFQKLTNYNVIPVMQNAGKRCDIFWNYVIYLLYLPANGNLGKMSNAFHSILISCLKINYKYKIKYNITPLFLLTV